MKRLKDIGLPDAFEGEAGEEPACAVEAERQPRWMHGAVVFVCASQAVAACDRSRDWLSGHYGAMRSFCAIFGDAVSTVLTGTNGPHAPIAQVNRLGDEGDGGYVTVRPRRQWPPA